MLYDNALLALVYTEAYQETQRAYCREVICRTLDYVLTELTDPLGGFYCGQDADSDGVEGKYYVFTPEELRGILGQGAADLQLAYLAGAMQDYPMRHSFTLLTLLETLWPTAELVCTAEKLPAELLTFLREKPRTGLSVLMKTAENQTRLAALAPFTAAYPIPSDGARYYLCWGKACLNPVKTIEELKKLLS